MLCALIDQCLAAVKNFSATALEHGFALARRQCFEQGGRPAERLRTLGQQRGLAIRYLRPTPAWQNASRTRCGFDCWINVHRPLQTLKSVSTRSKSYTN